MGGSSGVSGAYRSSLLSVVGRCFIAIQSPHFERGRWNVCNPTNNRPWSRHTHQTASIGLGAHSGGTRCCL
jgi:hypothetical protein